MTTSQPTVAFVTTEHDKGRHALGVFRLEYEKAQFSLDEAQRVNNATSELQDLLRDFFAKTRVPQEFLSEEVRSNYGYYSGYKRPLPMLEQVDRLREFFPQLNGANLQLASQPLLPGAEGCFGFPRWQKVAPTYGEAVEKAFEALTKVYGKKFVNYLEGKLGPQYLRQHARTVEKLQTLGDQQKDFDILVVQGQFGIRHRGRSTRRARVIFESNDFEFGLGAFAIACMLLVHQDRLKHFDDLWIDCAGDEYSLVADGRFGDAPIFDFDDGQLKFRAHWVSGASGRYGSASGFVAQ